MRHNFQVDQRAWVALEPVSAHISDAEQVLYAQYELKNWGKTPAYNLSPHLWVIPSNPAGSDFELTYPKQIGDPKPLSVGLLMPQQIVPFDKQYPTLSYPRTDTYDVVSYGYVEYSDIFDRRRTTCFCRYLSPKDNYAAFHVCPKGNSFDHKCPH